MTNAQPEQTSVMESNIPGSINPFIGRYWEAGSRHKERRWKLIRRFLRDHHLDYTSRFANLAIVGILGTNNSFLCGGCPKAGWLIILCTLNYQVLFLLPMHSDKKRMSGYSQMSPGVKITFVEKHCLKPLGSSTPSYLSSLSGSTTLQSSTVNYI